MQRLRAANPTPMFREGEMSAGAVLVCDGFEIDAGASTGPAAGVRLRGDREATDSRGMILTK